MESESELIRAIRFRDAPAVSAFVHRGDDVVSADSFGFTPLHYSASCYDPLIAGTLIHAIGRGSPVLNKLNPFQQTPLLIAALYNNYNVFQLLLENGADPNKEVVFGQTALHTVVRLGKYKYIKHLIGRGADVNWIDCFGLTPLRIHLSGAFVDVRITRLLIKSGAEMNETRFDQRAILTLALHRWKVDNLVNFSYLVRHGAKVDAVNFFGETALHFAARVTPSEVVRFLVVNHGADITARNVFGFTPLTLAVRYRNRNALQALRYLEEVETERQMRALGI